MNRPPLARPWSRAVLSCVDPKQLAPEFRSCAGLMFRAPIAVATGETVERDGFVFTDLCKARMN
jgi:hypothetical protein